MDQFGAINLVRLGQSGMTWLVSLDGLSGFGCLGWVTQFGLDGTVNYFVYDGSWVTGILCINSTEHI